MAILMFVLGTILGSFYLCLGTRLPKKEKITGRSKCDNCHHTLKWYELIPLFSFIFQRGKCRYCHKKISVDHFWVELLTGLCFLLGYLYLGNTIRFYIYLVLVSLAIIIFITDLKYLIILDSPLVIASILVFILKIYEVGLKSALFGVLYGLGMLAIMYLIKLLGDFLFKRESLGGGDIKLSFLIGLSIGYPHIGMRMGLIALIFASFLALPYALVNTYIYKKNELPYGPFLISSMIIIFVFIEKFTNLLVFFSLY